MGIKQKKGLKATNNTSYYMSMVEGMKLIKVIISITGFFGFIKGDVLHNVTLPRLPRPRPLCGRDKSLTSVVYEGYARIETYPWLGSLYYATNDRLYSTSVVLVTTQVVIGAAMDIDRLPKVNIRENSRVVLGGNCSRKGIQVRDYSYHPDFKQATFSALAIIQLETKFWMRDLTPICPPPALGEVANPRFYAIAPSDDCKSSLVKIYKMSYLNMEQCKTFYRKSELDVTKMWPTHTICAKAQRGPECVWENGAVLVMRQDNKWHLIGFGIHGPGCRAPSRFLDYAAYRPWLRSSVARIGVPTVTRLADNHLVLRRSLKNVQRFGPCDPEEVHAELFTDRTEIRRGPSSKRQRVTYNFTIFSNLEYSCIAFRSYRPGRLKWAKKETPYIRLKRWCSSPKEICYNSRYLQVDFAIEIFFHEFVVYRVMVYGREIRIVDRKKLMSHLNKKKPYIGVYKGGDQFTKNNTFGR